MSSGAAPETAEVGLVMAKLAGIKRRALMLAVRPVGLCLLALVVASATSFFAEFSHHAGDAGSYVVVALLFAVGVRAAELARRRVIARANIARLIDTSLGLKDRVLTLSESRLTAEQRDVLNRQVAGSLSKTTPEAVISARFDWSEWISCALLILIAFVVMFTRREILVDPGLTKRIEQLSTSPSLPPKAQAALAAVVQAAKLGASDLGDRINDAQAALGAVSDDTRRWSSRFSERSSSQSQSLSSAQSSFESSAPSLSAQSSDRGQQKTSKSSSGSKDSVDSSASTGLSGSAKGNAQMTQSGEQSTSGAGSSAQEGAGSQSGQPQSAGASQSGQGSAQGQSASGKDGAGSSSGGSQSGGAGPGAAGPGASQGQSSDGSDASAGEQSAQSQSSDAQGAKQEALQILSQMKDGAAQSSSGQGGSQKSSDGNRTSTNNSSDGKSSGSSGKQASSAGGKKPGSASSNSSNDASSTGSGDGAKGGVSSSASAKRFEDGPGGDKRDRGERFEERSITPKDENFDERFTTGSGELSTDENAQPGQDVTLGDIQRAKPQALSEDVKQRIPREYEGILR